MIALALSARQVDLARHALGLPNERRRSYRNRFCCGPGHADYEEWRAMVIAGAARQFPLTARGRDSLFALTETGARITLRPGEALDDEDFPRNPR
jgi:hypothetical protein